MSKLPAPRTPSQWAKAINAAWRGSVDSIIETGRLLNAAKDACEHGAFLKMVENALPFNPRTAQRLMAIAADQRIAKAARASLLPPNWSILAEITELDDQSFEARIEDGTISADMDRADLRKFRTEAHRDERLAEMRALASAPIPLPVGPFNAGIADPPWENPDAPIGFSTRHYRSHYPTMTPEEIAGLCVAPIFTSTAFLAMWITRHMLAIGAHVTVLKAWNFTPTTIVTWDKEWPGLGNGYVRDRTEHLVLATRGKPAAPQESEHRPDSIVTLRRTKKHSEKPMFPQTWIEQWFPNMAYVELFGRGDSRPGWATWGHEAKPSKARTS